MFRDTLGTESALRREIYAKYTTGLHHEGGRTGANKTCFRRAVLEVMSGALGARTPVYRYVNGPVCRFYRPLWAI